MLPSDPATCVLLGFCPSPDAGSPIPSGVMFLALGLVWCGLAWWRAQRRASAR
jgi:hypothetical protein